jgi:hypothetical protein
MSTATLSEMTAQPIAVKPTEQQILDWCCELTLSPSPSDEIFRAIAALDEEGRKEFLRLLDTNHVIVRALEPVARYAALRGDSNLIAWTGRAISAERARVANALSHLHEIVTELEAAGCPTTVIKTLEHFPDLGSDLDLYTTALGSRVRTVMEMKFNAKRHPRSWGDRIAQKWNFSIPGLPESVEVHIQRLGQMGEHTSLAQRFVTRRVSVTIPLGSGEGKTFFIPAPEERIVVATLQRMYRHFYFRVCDMVNSAHIMESGTLDLAELKRASERAGIWPGVASYLTIVSDFVKRYRGYGIDLPGYVTSAAICGGKDIFTRAGFLRVPILPQGAHLYRRQVMSTALSGDVPATFRLGLLPYLASTAAVMFKLTGNDKGVW